ncbi:MAG UNVERIFIED_CONTAM: hypothetical protein LVR29_03085 [Microcystis novacekii LVE1205-3]
MENIIDSSHIPYTHHLTIGNRANAAPLELEIIESNRQGFKGILRSDRWKGQLGQQYSNFICSRIHLPLSHLGKVWTDFNRGLCNSNPSGRMSSLCAFSL